MAGKLWAWGTNYVGKLGDNSTTRKSSPVQTAGFGSDWLKPASSSATNTRFAAAIKDDGTLWTWGYNNNGQLGDNSTLNKSSPIQTIAGGTNWSEVSCGYSFASAVKKDGTLWLWGRNLFGQIGNNTTNNASSPVQTMTYGTTWVSTSAAIDYVAAIKTDGTLWMWGRNYWGNLGDGTRTDESSPVQTASLGTNWSQVSCGQRAVVALKTDGTIWSWGDNGYGQLGDDSSTAKSSPVQVLGGSNWSSVSAGSMFNLAIKKDGTLWTWGKNNSGELGDNTGVRRSSPVQVVGGATNWTRISAGYYHSVATKSDGSLWSWGRGALGQLGNNTNTIQVSSPVQTIMASTTWSYIYANTDSTYAIESLPPYLSVATSAAQIYNSQPFGVQPVINILDSSNNLITSGTYSISVSPVSGSLILGGTTTANSSGGVAAFTDLSLTGTGNGSLLFTASGYTSAINGPLSVLPPVPVMPIRTETSGKIPTSGQLFIGELAINITDRKGYVKKSDGTIVNVFTGLQSGTITSGQIGNAAVVSGSIASGSVGQFAIASGSITAEHIASGAVINSDIADSAVTSGKIASGAIGTLHISSGGVQNVNIASGAVLSGNIASGQIGQFHLASGSVTSGAIASGSVSQFKLSSGAVNSGQIGNGAVVSGSVASGQIGTYHLASGVGSQPPGGVNGNLQYNLSGTFAGGTATSYSSNSGHLTITAQSGYFTPLFVKADASQVVALQEWQNNSGSPRSYINASGTFYGVVDGGLF